MFDRNGDFKGYKIKKNSPSLTWRVDKCTSVYAGPHKNAFER